jgi:hypothetical protein
MKDAPPSSFEYSASKYAQNHRGFGLGNINALTWYKIRNAYSERIINAEKSFWNRLGSEPPTRTPIYRNFIRCNNDGSWHFEPTPISDAHSQPDIEPNEEPQETNNKPPPNNERNDEPPPNNHANHNNPPDPPPNANANNNLQPPTPQEFDQDGIPVARDRATDLEIFHNKCAVIDHISGSQCLGFAGATFNELNHIPNNMQQIWAGAFGEACREINKQLSTPHPNSLRSALRLERRIKWKNILPTLLLRKPPRR